MQIKKLSKHGQVESYLEDLSTKNPFSKSKFNLDLRVRIYNFFSFGIGLDSWSHVLSQADA
jgi:hypothetical protein